MSLLKLDVACRWNIIFSNLTFYNIRFWVGSLQNKLTVFFKSNAFILKLEQLKICSVLDMIFSEFIIVVLTITIVSLCFNLWRCIYKCIEITDDLYLKVMANTRTRNSLANVNNSQGRVVLTAAYLPAPTSTFPAFTFYNSGSVSLPTRRDFPYKA